MAPLSWLRRFVAQHRRIVVVVLVALAALALTEHLKPRPEPGVAVVVTAREVASGAQLTHADLRTVELPGSTVPAHAARDPAELVGRTAGLTLAKNTIVQDAMLSGSPVPEGRALVPITLADAQLRELLVPGTALTLVMTDETGISVVTGDARVAAAPAPSSGTGLGGVTRSTVLLLVDVPSDVAGRVAVLGQQNQLNVVLGKT